MAAGRELEVLNTLKLGAAIHTTPCAAGGVLFIATDKCLLAIAK